MRILDTYRTLSRAGLPALACALLLLSGTALADSSATIPTPPDLPKEEDDASVRRTCERIGSKLGSVSTQDCLDRPLRPSGAHSVTGTPLLVAEYAPLPTREPVGRVLLFGGIHGDEYSSVSIVFKWMSMLDRFHSGLFHWRVMPLLNPDGLLRRRSQRMNENGVDLNRNFPSPNWREEAEDYWVRRTSRNPRRYPGPDPLSEPESQYLHREIERFKPDVIVSVHAPSHVVDYDGPKDPPKKLGPLYLKLMGTYPGSLGRYAGVHRGIPVVTIELPSAGIMPKPAEQNRIWVDLVRYLRVNIPRISESSPTAGEVAAAN
jgi:hypothetical protein